MPSTGRWPRATPLSKPNKRSTCDVFGAWRRLGSRATLRSRKASTSTCSTSCNPRGAMAGRASPRKAFPARATRGIIFGIRRFMPFLFHLRSPLHSPRPLGLSDRHTRQGPRAREELSLPGALFPWRTNDGEETSAYFPRGNGAVPHRRGHKLQPRSYATSSGDESVFLEWRAGFSWRRPVSGWGLGFSTRAGATDSAYPA